METKRFNVFLGIAILYTVHICEVIAQDLSTVYIDINAGKGEYQPEDQPTMGEIELSLITDNENSFEAQLINLTRYVTAIFDQPTINTLANFATAVELEIPFIGDGDNLRLPVRGDNGRIRFDFIALSPLLDAIERSSSDIYSNDNVSDSWTDNTKSVAFYSLVSALRFGVCLDFKSRSVQSDDAFNSSVICERPDYGKISDWHFSDDNRTGFFRVDDMKVNQYKIEFDQASKQFLYKLLSQWSYEWHVSVDRLDDNPGYLKAKRVELGEFELEYQADANADPFNWDQGEDPRQNVNLPTLPDSAKNPVNGEIWKRGLDRRLFTFGNAIKATTVVATQYKMLRKDNDSITSDEIYVDPITKEEFFRGDVLVATHALSQDHPYLQTSSKSCIDIMFKGGYPSTFQDPPFPDNQPGWCLGRCPTPVIQNSR